MDSMFPRIDPAIEGVASAINQLTDLNERLQQKLIEAEDTITQLRREYATWVIEACSIYEDHADRGPVHRPNYGVKDHGVFELAHEYSCHHVGICTNCSRRAPFIDQDTEVCAWGCALRTPSQAPAR